MNQLKSLSINQQCCPTPCSPHKWDNVKFSHFIELTQQGEPSSFTYVNNSIVFDGINITHNSTNIADCWSIPFDSSMIAILDEWDEQIKIILQKELRSWYNNIFQPEEMTYLLQQASATLKDKK